MSEAGTVRITVVTPTHNRPDSLLRLLRALRDGTFPASHFDAVIVADGCNDDTVSRARAEPLPFRVRVLEQNPGRGAAAARNLGAQFATGELLVFLDDDIEPSPALLTEHWREYERVGSPCAIIGPPLPVRSAHGGLHEIVVWAWWERQFELMRRPGHRFTYDNVFSGNLAVPSALFASLNGFDIEFNSCRDDSELGLRLMRHGARICFAPAAAAWHHELRNTTALNQRKRAEGVADVRLARLYPELWPVLHLSAPLTRRLSALGVLRRLASDAPRLGRIVAWIIQRLLPPIEAVRFRGMWRRAQGALMYYWYWDGAMRALQGRPGFDALRAECVAHMAQQYAQAAPDWELDLATGLDAAERALDAARPGAATIRWGPMSMGRLPPHPAAEPLGGRHLRTALAGDLAGSLASALATSASAGSPVLRRSDCADVSVIIPAYNAASTLGETLDSLIDQTSARWEAIVVDDGSTDDTAVVAARYVARDRRIRMLRQANAGEGAARNAGLSQARFEWVLFLDADDWLLPDALEHLTRATEVAEVDAVLGGWERVAADGRVGDAEYGPLAGDLFEFFARYCVFPIHSALVRRSALRWTGPFDTTLRTCADWDFWQRLTRSGARFSRMRDVVARYRMRAGSPATLVTHLWPDGLRLIAQGHAPDPRIDEPAHAAGASDAQLADARYEFGCWVAGLIIGRGGEPSEIVVELARDDDPGLNPEMVANQLYRTIPLAGARALDAWDELWPTCIGRIESFLAAIEHHSRAPFLARRTMRVLERLTLQVSRQARPFTRGETLAAEIEVSQPFPLLSASPGVERAHCTVLANGKRLGTVLVPVVSQDDANERALTAEIAARYAWPILGSFFRDGPYRDLAFLRGPRGITVTREGVVVATGLSDADALDAAKLHDHVGWTVFLQELWGRSDWPADRFYDPHNKEDATAPRSITGARLTIEVSAELPWLRVSPELHQLEVDVQVGGAPLGIVSLPVSSEIVAPAALRAAITLQSAFALCRVAVQEGLLGHPSTDGTLRQRLAARAAEHREHESSARAFLPMPNELGKESLVSRAFDRHHFEAVFARTPDPWSYVTPYEQLKYEQTLSLLPASPVARALEIACAEGRFTRQLAPRVEHLVAGDISSIALERARTACNGVGNVDFRQLDLVKDPLEGPFDLIVCSEVLYYLGSTDTLLEIGGKLRDALVPGGRLILAHTNVAVDDPAETGLAWDVPFGAKRIGELLAELPNVHFAHELRTELYRIQAFERRDDASPTTSQRAGHAEVVQHAPHQQPAPHVAARFRRPHERGAVGAAPERPTTSQLPILMYHQVAPARDGGSPSRYCVTPEAFATQLDYLARAGFRSATLDEWYTAVHYRRPLPGRAVMFTFDDAYREFATHAFPILKQHGFSAIVFVPCGFVGGTNAWDLAASESIALLDWNEVRNLANEGVVFGAHSMTHTPMTALTAAAVTREAADSKAVLERELGVPVTAFAYPHGENDAVVQQLVAACGYRVAFTTRFGKAGFADPPMALPRIEVTGYDDLASFIGKLGA